MASDGFFKPIQDDITSALVNTTKTSTQLANEDLAFQRSSNRSIAISLDKQASRLLRLAQGLTKAAVAGTDIPSPGLRDAEAVEDNWRSVVDVVDNLLEKTDACLDEYTGVIKRATTPQADTQSPAITARKQLPTKSFRAQNIPKPQLLFDRKTDNSETAVFEPLLRSKPHALVPLEESLAFSIAEDGVKRFRHPYEAEIEQSQCPPKTYLISDPIAFLPFESTTATFVDTIEGVTGMLADLKSAKEIAIDLEHHDTHSYIGLVSLMQISTREKDWVVDTLKPWREELQMLNEVFTDPAILKVFHGSTMDMIWLQRDLGLYVVGLFDTYHATVALGYPKHSLAFLLSKFANFNAQKKYQLADWRIRPLLPEMFDYARSDTHYLLHVYDNLRNELIEKSDLSQPDGNLVDYVLKKSKEEALQRYERHYYDAEGGTGPNGWCNMLIRTPALLTKEQFAVFRAIHEWRDKIARKEDENPHLVMPKHALFSIAREMPMDMPSLLGCSQPISIPMRLYAADLLEMIRHAKEAAVNGPELKDVLSSNTFIRGKRFSKEATALSQSSAVPRKSESAESLQYSTPQVRTGRSRFWGSLLSDSPFRRGDSGDLQGKFHLSLPLPQLTAEAVESTKAFDESAQEPAQTDSDLSSKNRVATNEESLAKDIFVIKELSGPRKRKSTDFEDERKAKKVQTSMQPPNDDTTAHDDDNGSEIKVDDVREQAIHDKAARKAQKKAQKNLLKEQWILERVASANDKADGKVRAEEVFDYANAPSVLHAKEDGGSRKGRKETFDPYTKSLDAPKAVKRTMKDVPGRSFTFKR